MVTRKASLAEGEEGGKGAVWEKRGVGGNSLPSSHSCDAIVRQGTEDISLFIAWADSWPTYCLVDIIDDALFIIQ